MLGSGLPGFARVKDRYNGWAVCRLAGPLPCPDAEFDVVFASLVPHHLQDWGPVLAEAPRTGGRLIASVNHPTAKYCIERLQGCRPDYFETRAQAAEWPVGTRSSR
ncbi:hypothetical protein GCM10011609_23690 [Lentzea pudingi]|uniref:Methyltransferase type 11 domain-containing protein n=1 Tax=Lentzea pudingi TaxID=1789439 RepID=A0ABQ2HPT1_9PSEU|nr:methyltransferase domain-containing protein [Lentzea pudingi]GGM86458.1 hypothetical protein GCM10011609_23690 [Lentzea pudingi]